MSVYNKVHQLDSDAVNAIDHRLLGSGRQRKQGGFLPLLLGALGAANAAKSLFGLGKKGRKKGGLYGRKFGDPLYGFSPGAYTPIPPGPIGMGKSAGARSGGARSGGVKKYRKGQRHMQGEGFFDWIGDAAKTVAGIVPGVIQAVPKVLETAGQAANLYRTVRGGKRKAVKKSSGSDGRAKRAQIVKRVMKEQGLSLINASKYVKAHGLY